MSNSTTRERWSTKDDLGRWWRYSKCRDANKIRIDLMTRRSFIWGAALSLAIIFGSERRAQSWLHHSSVATLIGSISTTNNSNDFVTFNLPAFSGNEGTVNTGPYCALLDIFDGPATNFSAAMNFFSNFPAGTIWNWSFLGSALGGEPYGYPCQVVGYGSPGFYPSPAANVQRAMHPNSFTNLTHTFNYTFTTSVTDTPTNTADDIDWLIETWVCTQANPPVTGSNAGVNEVGFYAYAGPVITAAVLGNTFNFRTTLATALNGGPLNLYVSTNLGQSPPFTTMLAMTTSSSTTPLNLCDGNAHTINFGAILQALVSNGVISNSNYIVGYDSGPEIYQNAGAASASVFSWNWA